MPTNGQHTPSLVPLVLCCCQLFTGLVACDGSLGEAEEWAEGAAEPSCHRRSNAESGGGSLAALAYGLRAFFSEERLAAWGQQLHRLALGVGCILGCFLSFLVAVLTWILTNARSGTSPSGSEHTTADFTANTDEDFVSEDETPLQTVSRMSSGHRRRYRSPPLEDSLEVDNFCDICRERPAAQELGWSLGCYECWECFYEH